MEGGGLIGRVSRKEVFVQKDDVRAKVSTLEKKNKRVSGKDSIDYT